MFSLSLFVIARLNDSILIKLFNAIFFFNSLKVFGEASIAIDLLSLSNDAV